jgi:hypothetical protein
MDNINMQEDTVLVSEAESNFLPILGFSILIMLILFFYTQAAIVDASWIGCIISLTVLGLLIIGIGSFIYKTYYFSEKSIIIADHNNEFIDEIILKDSILSWNEYFEIKKREEIHFLIIKTEKKTVTITKSDYKNYDEIVDYFKNSKIVRDINIEKSLWVIPNEFNSKLDILLRKIAVTIIAILLFFFAFISSDKVETDSKLYFVGKIERIDIVKGKNSRVILTIKGHPAYDFVIYRDREFFNSYNYYDGKKTYVNLNKKIKLTISKDDYDWKTKNELIKFLDFSDGKTWNVEQYEMLE